MMATASRVALVALGVFAVASCSSDASTSSSSVTTVLVTSASFTTIVPTTTTVASTSPATTTTAGGPLLTPDDAHMVADCVKFIPIGAVIADAEATDLWDIAERDYDKLTDLCTNLLRTSPATMASLSLKLTAFEMSQESTTTVGDTAVTTTTP